VAGNLVDLDELILKCRNDSSKEFIRESVVSYRAGAYRSSIVSCWVAVCYDLIEKLRELALAGDKQAEEKVEELGVTSRTVVWQFVEQFWFEFVPVLHRLQGRLAAQG
jgi:hypothetical protein